MYLELEEEYIDLKEEIEKLFIFCENEEWIEINTSTWEQFYNNLMID